jgi:pSer/pThr/pTyr-binding forkhead associated (FHA) protein
MTEDKNDREENKTASLTGQDIDAAGEISPVIIEELRKIRKGSAGLIELKGPSIGEKFLIKRDVLTIGRSSDSDILLDDITVSRQHALIEKIPDGFLIKDLESLNGTYLNGEIINEAVLLKKGDKIQIGKYIFLFFSF